MRHKFCRVLSALATFCLATISAAADDRETCAKATLGEEAIAACNRLISQNPADAAAYNNRGNAHLSGTHDYDHAIFDFTQAIMLDPRMAQAYFGRGRGSQERHDYEGAILDFIQVIRLDPNFAAAYNGRGGAYFSKGDYDRALADYDQAIRLDPKFVVAYRESGLFHSIKGDLDRAIADFDQAIRLDPKHAVAYSLRGGVYSYKRDYDRAIADFSEVIRLRPDWGAYSDRGHAYEKKGDYTRAIADYDQSLKIDPNNAMAREGRERVQALLTATRPSPAATQALLPPQTSPTIPMSAERRVALVIGNSAYTSSLVSALPNPRRDAKLVADGLRQAGFETTELTDLDRVGMAKALQSFRVKAASADWALVYFAGHGIEINRVNYLIPVDAKLAESGDVELETVSYEAILNAVGSAKALRIIVLDACRNNPFKPSMHQTATLRGTVDRGLAAPPEAEPGTLVVYSAKEGQTAVDGDGVNSPFARAFVNQLKVPGRDVRRLFDFVRDDVLEATNNRQLPFTYGSLPSRRDFFFVAGK
jgi:tetratricopeptide (TPR) repeat protein